MYKAKNKLLPKYLLEIIPPTIAETSSYPLRNSLNYILPKSKKNYFLKSFIPSAIKAWNDTTLDLKRATSLQNLKAKLSDLYKSTTYHLFLNSDGHGAINHSRLRMGLSALNAHRRRYNFINYSNCSYCDHKQENAKHFLLYCPAFAVQRNMMLEDLRERVLQSVLPYIQYLENPKLSLPFSKLLLTGTGKCNIDVKLFEIVQNFISQSNRFR